MLSTLPSTICYFMFSVIQLFEAYVWVIIPIGYYSLPVCLAFWYVIMINSLSLSPKLWS